MGPLHLNLQFIKEIKDDDTNPQQLFVRCESILTNKETDEKNNTSTYRDRKTDAVPLEKLTKQPTGGWIVGTLAWVGRLAGDIYLIYDICVICFGSIQKW